jgi:hypothetical protein
MSTEDPRNETLGHVWVEYEGKYFDAETPNGVDSWKQLPWMIEFYSKNKSYPTDIENLNEVGEANLKPYKWQELDMNGYVVFARFVTDSETQYDIELTTTSYHPEDSNLSIKALLIEFIAKPKGAEGSSAYVIVNKGEMYRVMATIVDIVKKYTKKLKAKAILYSPSKKQGEDFGTQRDQLYKAFISKAIPGVKFEQKRDLVAAILPDTQINELVTDTEVICDNCGWEWSIKDGGKDLYICHKCGHDNNPDLGEASDPQAGTALPYGSGFAPVKEAKQEVKDSMVVVLSRKDNQINLYDLKTNEALGVINTYGNEVTGVAAKKGYGPLMYELGMANVYPNGLQSDRHGNTEPAAENIWKKYIAGTSPNIKVQKLTPKDKDYRTTYAGDGYDSSYISDFYNYKFYNPDIATLKQLIQKGNTLSDELKKQIVLDSDKLYSDMVHETNSKDPFGLNKLAKTFIKETFKETWSLKEGFVSLSKYMIDNGMNIKPLPKIKVIKDDEENASNLLGKTAYYNPNEKSITLYTMNRHPKDILRSFAHEMIHHEQNLNGKLNNITTQNTNEDGDLPEIEKEAYEKGNMMLRNWEDSIKNV